MSENAIQVVLVAPPLDSPGWYVVRDPATGEDVGSIRRCFEGEWSTEWRVGLVADDMADCAPEHTMPSMRACEEWLAQQGYLLPGYLPPAPAQPVIEWTRLESGKQWAYIGFGSGLARVFRGGAGWYWERWRKGSPLAAVGPYYTRDEAKAQCEHALRADRGVRQ